MRNIQTVCLRVHSRATTISKQIGLFQCKNLDSPLKLHRRKLDSTMLLEKIERSMITDLTLMEATKSFIAKNYKEPQEPRPTKTMRPIRKDDRSWAKDDKAKAKTFAEDFVKVFQLHIQFVQN